MQTWHVLEAFRSELAGLSRARLPRTRSQVLHRSLLQEQARNYTSPADASGVKAAEEHAGPDLENSASSGDTQHADPESRKMKGKQRWRAHQRVLKKQQEQAGKVAQRQPTPTSRANSVLIRKIFNGIGQGNSGDAVSPATALRAPQVPQSIVKQAESKPLPFKITDTLPSPAIPDNLPKPAYALPSLQDRLRAKLQADFPERPKRRGDDSNPHGRRVKESLAAAPFQTAFSQNAFAHALASPVREDSLSRLHLPTSCLLDFRIAELDPESPAKEQQRPLGERKRGKVQESVQYSLLPLSLATELSPQRKQSKPRTIPDTAATITPIRHPTPDTTIVPTGTATHITSTLAALQYITANPSKRVIPFAMSRRMLTNISATRNMTPTHVKWRPDMPELVLNAMRRIVIKKLGYLLKSKGSRDKPGLVSAVLGGGDSLDGLSRMEDVAGVIKLVAGLDEGEKRDVVDQHWNWRDYPFLDGVKPLPQQAYPRDSAFKTVAYRNIRVPIYAVSEVLGHEMAKGLIEKTIFAEGGKTGVEEEVGDDGVKQLRRPTKYVVLSRSTGTVQALMWLMKLQAFLGHGAVNSAQPEAVETT